MASSSLWPSFQLTFLSTMLVLSSASASNSSTKSNLSASRPFSKIYAFGDSFTDTGNTFLNAANYPYGMTFFHRPTNRWSDGRLVIDFAAEALSLPYLPPYLHLSSDPTAFGGVNFAVAGGTAIDHTFFAANGVTLALAAVPIDTQLAWFNTMLSSKGCYGSINSSPQCQAVLDDALYWVGEIGANDYAYTSATLIPKDIIMNLIISHATRFLQAILSKGVKYVAVQGLPPTGCLALSMAVGAPGLNKDDMGCVWTANQQMYRHNEIYKAQIANLRQQFPDATIVYLDYWAAYRTVVKNPTQYGFMVPYRACCGAGVAITCGTPASTLCPDPSTYINWDGVHLTEAMYKVVADMLLNGPGYSEPPFSELVSRKLRGG